MRRILGGIAAFSWKRPVSVVLGLACATFLFLVPLSRLEGSFDILKLLPERSRDVRRLKETIDAFGGEDRLVVGMEAGRNTGREEMEEFVELFLRILTREDAENDPPLFRRIGGLSGKDAEEIFSSLFELGVYFLDGEGVERLLERFSDEGIAEIVRKDAVLARKGSAFARKRIRHDPLDLSGIFFASMPGYAKGFAGGWRRVSRDGRLVLLFLQPTEQPQDGAFSLRLLRFAERCARKAREEFGPGAPAVFFAGGYALAVSDMGRITGVAGKTLVASLIIVSVMLYAGFGEWRAIFLILLLLGVAVVWTAGFAGLLFGKVTAASATFAAVLLGLGVDFAIHIYSRFRVELSRNVPPPEAVVTAHTTTGTGILMGAVTTAAAFYILALSDFSGMREFGILVGTGVLLSVFIYFSAFPALLRLTAARRGSAGRVRDFGLENIYDLCLARRYGLVLLLFGAAAVSAALYLFAFGDAAFSFETDPAALRPARDPVMERNRRYAHAAGMSLVHFPVVVHAHSFECLLSRTRKVALTLRELAEEGTISRYRSPGDFLRPVEVQKQTLARLRDVDFERVKKVLRDALVHEGFKPEIFASTFSYLDGLRDRARRGQTLSARELLSPPLNRLASGFIKIRNGGKDFYSLSVFYTRSGEERSFDLGKVKRLLESPDGKVYVTGVNVMSRIVVEKIRWWIMRLYPGVFLVVFLLVWMGFRSLRLSLLAVVPLCAGILFLGAAMKLLGVKLNVMNFGILPLLIGIGVDNGIHIVRGYVEEGEGKDAVRRSLSVTGRAVVMTSLTTMAGFGSLAFGEYRGIISMGVLAALGIGFCLATAVFLLPAVILAWEECRGGKM